MSVPVTLSDAQKAQFSREIAAIRTQYTVGDPTAALLVESLIGNAEADPEYTIGFLVELVREAGAVLRRIHEAS